MPPRRRPRPDDQRDRDQDDGAGTSGPSSSARLSVEAKAKASSPEDLARSRSKSKSVEEEEVEETSEDEDEEVDDAISLCNFRYHLGSNYRVDAIKLTTGAMRLFHPSSYEDVARVLQKWYPGEELTEETPLANRPAEPSGSEASYPTGGVPSTPLASPIKQEPTPGSSTSKTAPSPPRKRKSKLDSVYLEAELIGGGKQSQPVGVGHLTVIAYAPKDIAQRLNAEYRASKGAGSKVISPDTVLNLGYLDISSPRDKDHPLRHFSPSLIDQGWIIPRNAYIILQRPFFTDKHVSRHFKAYLDDGAYFVDKREYLYKAWQLMATLSADFVLPTKVLDYGQDPEEVGSVTKARSGAGRLKRFIASVLNSSPTDVQDGCCSHIELDTSWPAEDWWQPRSEEQASRLFYTLPKRQVRLPLRAVAELRPPTKKTKTSRAEDAILEKPQPAKSGRRSIEEVLPTDPVELEHYLPLSTTINSLMRACRPSEEVPAVKPSKDVVATPLYKFQQQALAWMIARETSVEEDIGTPMPNWLRIKTRGIEACSCIAQHSVAITKIGANVEEAPQAPQPSKKARRGIKSSAPKQTQQPARSSEQKAKQKARIKEERSPRRFYIDLVTGTPSQVKFCFSSPREPGGILADELGLGKTLEILSLVAARQRPKHFKDHSLSARMIAEKVPEDRPFTSTATLVIAPKALLPQWIQECQRHLPTSPILLYEPTWKEKHPPRVTVAEMKRKLEGVLIVFVSYEDLSRDYSRSTSAKYDNKLEHSISPLLEVFWWRIVADESQLFAGKAAHSPLAKMCNSLWRSNSWLCSSTPLNQPKDLGAICTYLDLELFKNRAVFAELIEAAFYRGDAESVRQLRGLCAKIMWRHERADVDSQIVLPSHTELEIKVKATGLEQSIRERQYTKTRDTIAKALASNRRLTDPDLVMNLRKLISHPSIAPALGYSNIASFESIFRRLARKTQDEINACKIMYAVQALVSNAMRKAYVDKDMDTGSWGDNITWLEEGRHFSKDGVDMLLLQAAKFCEDAVESDTVLNGEALSTATERQTALRIPEALYWIKSALGEPASPIDHLDPDRVTNLTFRKKVVQARDVPVRKQKYYYPVARDVGTVEDPAWLEKIVGTGKESQDAARKAIKGQGEGTEPVFVNRLRGGKDGARAEEQMWTWVPRRTFAAVHSKILSLQVQITKLHSELKWNRTRLEDVQRSKGRQKGEEAESDDEEASDDPDEGGHCPICLEEPIIAGVLPCLHSACYPCLVEMSRKNTNECPTCRRPYRGVNDITQAVKGTADDNTDLSALDYGSKINRIASEVKSRLAKDPTTKVVVFSLFSKMLNRVFQSLAAIGLECAVFAGPSTAQQDALTNFRDEEGPPVLLCPMKMSEGAAGLTLNFANVAIIVEPVLNEALMTQAIGRINRIGQTRPTTTLKMVAEDTIEERIVRLAKRRAASEPPVANAEADTLTKEELAWLFEIDVEEERRALFEVRPVAHHVDLAFGRGARDGAPPLDMDDPFVEGDDDGHVLLVEDNFDALAFDDIDDEDEEGLDDGADEELDDGADEGLDDGADEGLEDGADEGLEELVDWALAGGPGNGPNNHVRQ